ncbi:MAG: hypothetical protein ACI9Y1_003283 [Lentisphaeria bacterium]|jgi:hypothetical protein
MSSLGWINRKELKEYAKCDDVAFNMRYRGKRGMLKLTAPHTLVVSYGSLRLTAHSDSGAASKELSMTAPPLWIQASHLLVWARYPKLIRTPVRRATLKFFRRLIGKINLNIPGDCAPYHPYRHYQPFSYTSAEGSLSATLHVFR